MAGININRVVITGNLTRDPELRHIGSGTAVCDLGIAVNGREKRGDEWQDRADYFDVTVWGGMAENCAEYLAKGRPVAISGRLRLERWEKDGQKRSKVKIVADSVQFLNSRDRNDGGGSQASSGSESSSDVPAPSGGDDDIPF